MPEAKTQDHRKATAERNVEAILDGAERLLARRRQPSISAVAEEAGLSRVTVYSHFADRQRLIEAVVERGVRRAMAAIDSADPKSGSAPEALQRLIRASWAEIGHNEQIGRASAAELSPEAMRRAHAAARATIRKLTKRGRREGAFRTDVPVDWLVTSCLALIHAAAEEVREGELDSDAALEALSVTVADLFEGHER
jgi:TetR/AcrR family transcriptional regulator, mexCD-oprJ operon repressor